MRHRLGHVELHVSEGTPCETCYVEARKKKPLRIQHDHGLAKILVVLALGVWFLEYTFSGGYAKTPFLDDHWDKIGPTISTNDTIEANIT